MLSAMVASLAVSMTTITMPQMNIIPKPVKVTPSAGSFEVNQSVQLVADSKSKNAANLLRSRLNSVGLELKGSGNKVRLRVDESLNDLGKEGYRLSVKPDEIEIVGGGPAGAFYGVQTLLQLMPTSVFGKGAVRSLSVPGVQVEDKPRFRWRGGHLDVSRHFMPKPDVKKFIDLLAMHKMNVFHWHLTDDQGWRIEIKQYPKLTSVGAWRKDTMLVYSNPGVYSGKPHGGFYTQEDVKEIVKYASDRAITIVPEIEMPGHAQAAIAAYPELGNSKEPLEVFTKWGVNENVFNVKDSTIQFLKNVLDEVMVLFPGDFVHIGGDECPKVQWKSDPETQAKMKSLGLKDEHELQSWFIKQMDQHIASKGKRLIGWSEILEGGLAPGAALMVWLGDDGAMQAVSSGHDVVMSQNSNTYLDYYQTRYTAKEPHAIGGFLPLNKVYGYDPILPQMTAEHEKHVLGPQFQVWTEYIPDFKRVEYMAFPRACALSEVAWSPKASRNFDDFVSRLETHLNRLKALDVNHFPLRKSEFPVAKWTSDKVWSDYGPIIWDVSKSWSGDGEYDIRLEYQSGTHALTVKSLEVQVDGKTVVTHAPEGGMFAGAKPKNNTYRLKLASTSKEPKVVLNAIAKGDGGTDSRGIVYLSKIP